MVQIRNANECNCATCKGGESADGPGGEIVFGGWRCICPCHLKKTMSIPKSSPRSEPVTGAVKRRRTPATVLRSAGAKSAIVFNGERVLLHHWSAGAIKSAGKTVQWAIRRVGEHDFCSAKYDDRSEAEGLFNRWKKRNQGMQNIELVRVTVEPWPKKGKK